VEPRSQSRPFHLENGGTLEMRSIKKGSPMPSYLRVQSDAVLLSIKLQPRSSANEIGEPLGSELRVKVTAPPVDSAANEALVRLLSEKLNCAQHQVELVRGHTSRHKTIKLYGLNAGTVVRILTGATPPPAA